MSHTISAQLREQRGKGAARQLRASGRIPATMYGHGDETRTLSLDAKEFERLTAGINTESTIVDVEIEGGKKIPALIREVQTHPYRPDVLHVDLFQVHAGEKIKLTIPVRVTGTPAGVRNSGGVLQHSLHELEIECLPRDIPEAVEVDVTELEIGDTIHVRDLDIAKVKVFNDPDLSVCSVTMPTVAKLDEDAEAEAAEGVEEPEVIGRDEAGDGGDEGDAEKQD
jgi:large subunit ribosomal protein L25